MDPETANTVIIALVTALTGNIGLQLLKMLGERHKEQRESSKQVVDNELALSGGWEKLYTQALERIERLETTIATLQQTESELRAENVALKLRIAALEALQRGEK